jgi:hypothetical protein
MKIHAKKLYIIGGIIGSFFLLGVVTGVVRADNTIGDLQAQRDLLVTRMQQARDEYATIAEQKKNAQEYCSIATQKADEMKRLQELNASRQKEIDLIIQKIETLTSPKVIPLSK